MPKEKLTLYMDKKTSRLAHEVAASLGKSVSELVREYAIKLHQKVGSVGISPDIAKWIGILKTKKNYKALRNEHISARLKRYEDHT